MEPYYSELFFEDIKPYNPTLFEDIEPYLWEDNETLLFWPFFWGYKTLQSGLIWGYRTLFMGGYETLLFWPFFFEDIKPYKPTLFEDIEPNEVELMMLLCREYPWFQLSHRLWEFGPLGPVWYGSIQLTRCMWVYWSSPGSVCKFMAV